MKRRKTTFHLTIGGVLFNIAAKTAGAAVSIARRTMHRQLAAAMLADGTNASPKKRRQRVGDLDRLFETTPEGGWAGVHIEAEGERTAAIPAGTDVVVTKGGNSKWYRRVQAMKERLAA